MGSNPIERKSMVENTFSIFDTRLFLSVRNGVKQQRLILWQFFGLGCASVKLGYGYSLTVTQFPVPVHTSGHQDGNHQDHLKTRLQMTLFICCSIALYTSAGTFNFVRLQLHT